MLQRTSMCWAVSQSSSRWTPSSGRVVTTGSAWMTWKRSLEVLHANIWPSSRDFLWEPEEVEEKITSNVFGLFHGDCFGWQLRNHVIISKSLSELEMIYFAVAIYEKKLQLVNVGEIVAFKNCRVSDFDTWSLVGSSDVGDTTIDVRHGRNVELKSFYSKH